MAEIKKQYTDEDLEIQRMRQIFAQGEFDDSGVGDGTIKYIDPEYYLLLRNSRYVGVKGKKCNKVHQRKWIKVNSPSLTVIESQK